tara:strand:- start:242 stop:697 length:456 start_codon:yes stop_codon:yes gene_type:complete
MKTLRVPIQQFDYAKDLPLPIYATDGSAGVDLLAAIDEPITIDCGCHLVIPTGIAIAIPIGYEGQVRPRSGLAARKGVTILNSPGTIDSDYRGEISVVLINLGKEPSTIIRGHRIAQLIISPVVRVQWQEAKELVDTDRGVGGFGSTGLGA